MSQKTKAVIDNADAGLGLYHLLDPETRAYPYPLYHRLREQDPVHWDAYLHAWVVTRYDDVVTVLQRFSAERSPTPEQLTALGLSELNPIAQVLVRQMIFMDPPAHTRLRTLCAAAFTPARAETLRQHIQEITDSLIDTVLPQGRMDVIADLANPLPATVTAELMGVPVADRDQLKEWSIDFSEMLGNFPNVLPQSLHAGRREGCGSQCPQPGVSGWIPEDHLPDQHLRDRIQLGKTERSELFGRWTALRREVLQNGDHVIVSSDNPGMQIRIPVHGIPLTKPVVERVRT